MSVALPLHTKLRRSFVTPEGVDLGLELGSAGARASAFLIDATIILTILIVATLGLGFLSMTGGGEALSILWLIGFFVLRNCWFILCEMGSRGATPGKRLMGLRVVARDGARLTAGAVIARNAMREIEAFLPLSFLAQQTAKGGADTLLVILSLVWSGIFLFFPLFNKDRLRLGDLVAGTWVVQASKRALLDDLVGTAARPRRTFPESALSLYGIYELQTLEQVLRSDRPDAIATVAQVIRTKAGLPDDGDDWTFLSDYYAALCARLEAGLLAGQRREDKWQR